MKKRIFSRILALVMALSLLTTTVFAASLDDLQEAIDGTETEKTATEVVADAVPADKMTEASEQDTSDAGADPAEPTEPAETEDTTHVNGALVRQDTLEDGTTRDYFGYGWSQDTQSNWYYAIEAHDEAGNRYVVLLDDVSKGSGENALSGVVIGQDGSSQNVTIDMKGHSITGGDEGTVITVEDDAKLNLSNGTVSGGQIGINVLGTLILDTVTVTNNNTGVKINDGSKVTFNGDKNKADVELKVGGKTYKVDADTAEAMMKEPVAKDEKNNNWLLFQKGDNYVVAYTGTGDNTNQLTQGIVTTVMNAASTDGKTVTGFAIPEGVTEIGNDAFGYGNGKTLQSINLPEGLIRIGERAFSSCGNLKSITIPGSVKEIGQVTFYRCYKLEEVVLSEGLTKIPGQVFRELQSLKAIKIPTTVTEVDEKAFFDCGITSIWVYAEGGKDGSATIEALRPVASNRNIFAVTDEDAKLYRDGNVVTFGGNDQKPSLNEDGNVKVPTGSLSTADKNGQTTASIQLLEGATVVVDEKGNLTIPHQDGAGDVKVTVNETDWMIAAGDKITLKNDGSNLKVPANSTITASDSASITAPAGAAIGTDGMVTINGGVIDFTDKDENTIVITARGGMWVYPDGKVIVGNSSMDDGNGGKTIYPIGAIIKDSQITSSYHMYFENESEKILVMPAEVEEGETLVRITVDPATGIITVPNGGSTFMNDEKSKVSYPDGATLDRQGSAASNSNVVEYEYERSSGTVTTPEGSTITVGSDGTITVPERSTIAGVEYPYGATIRPNGDIVENPAPTVDLPDFTFDADAADTNVGTNIEDEAIPLAGLISRAQLVSYLYAREGSPDGEDAGDEYTLAWAWAVENEIEDEKNDPEEIVTVAILREVMTAYAKFLGTTFDVVIEEEDDMPVMNCDEILAEFYASLESKAA